MGGFGQMFAAFGAVLLSGAGVHGIISLGRTITAEISRGRRQKRQLDELRWFAEHKPELMRYLHRIGSDFDTKLRDGPPIDI